MAKEKVKLVKENVAGEEKENEVMEMVEQSKLNGKQRIEGDWITMTEAEVIKHQASGKLMGYDPRTKQGLLNEDFE